MMEFKVNHLSNIEISKSIYRVIKSINEESKIEIKTFMLTLLLFHINNNMLKSLEDNAV